MWIQIPDPDPDKEAWTGAIAPPADPKGSWTFELVRQRKSLPGFHDTTPFEWGKPVVGLLDFQRACTLVGTRVLSTEGGSLGVRILGARTVISGEFDALLTNLAIEDENAPCIAGLLFESEALGTWMGLDRAHPDRSDEALSVRLGAVEEERLDAPGWGQLSVKSRVVVSETRRTGSYRTSCVVRLELPAPVSLEDAFGTCMSLERLFGFLIGFRGKLPTFHLWTNGTYRVGEREHPEDGTLEVSGFDWRAGELPYRPECLSQRGAGGLTLAGVLERFDADRDSILARIYALEFSRQFSKNLNDRFVVVMPVLEEYLRSRYASAEEANYLEHKAAFFAWVDKAEDPNIQAFARKHLTVVDKQKAPSLRMLIERAIEHLNGRGFRFPVSMGKRLQQRRATLFHAIPELAEGEGLRFSTEQTAATALLLLHTLEDLGVDIAGLAADPYPIRDIAWFFPTLTPESGSPGELAVEA